MQAGKRNYDTIVVGIGSATCNLPAAGGVVIKLDGHAAAVDVMNYTGAGSQLHQASTAYIGNRMAAVDGNTFIIARTCDLQVLVANGHNGTGIFPISSFRHRQYYHAGTAVCSSTVGSVISYGDGLGAAHGIHGNCGIAN